MTDIERLPCGVEHELRADAAIIRSWIDVANGPINREALADRLDRYANAAAELTAEVEALRAEVDALARENEAMRRCAIRYLRWLGVTHKPLDAALREDMANPDMCGDAALAQENRNG